MQPFNEGNNNKIIIVVDIVEQQNDKKKKIETQKECERRKKRNRFSELPSSFSSQSPAELKDIFYFIGHAPTKLQTMQAIYIIRSYPSGGVVNGKSETCRDPKALLQGSLLVALSQFQSHCH